MWSHLSTTASLWLLSADHHSNCTNVTLWNHIDSFQDMGTVIKDLICTVSSLHVHSGPNDWVLPDVKLRHEFLLVSCLVFLFGWVGVISVWLSLEMNRIDGVMHPPQHPKLILQDCWLIWTHEHPEVKILQITWLFQAIYSLTKQRCRIFAEQQSVCIVPAWCLGTAALLSMLNSVLYKMPGDLLAPSCQGECWMGWGTWWVGCMDGSREGGLSQVPSLFCKYLCQGQFGLDIKPHVK